MNANISEVLEQQFKMTKYLWESKLFPCEFSSFIIVFIHLLSKIWRSNNVMKFSTDPVIKDDKWCQSWLHFSDLNPNFDGIVETDLMYHYLLHFLLGLTSYKFASLQGTNWLYIGPKP